MKEKKWAALEKECIQFFRSIYKEEEKIIVFGEGNLDASIMLVGEAPGEQETIQQRPFVGQAGKNLDEFLDMIGLKREEIYITSVVKFRPYKVNADTGRKSNRPPSGEEIGLNLSWLFREIELVKPKVLVTLGNTALRAVTGDAKANIGNVHGKAEALLIPEINHKLSLFPLYHPASIIYKRELKSTYLEDLDLLKDFLVREGFLAG